MERVECSFQAYERLGKEGLIERILEKKEEISDVFLFHFFVEDGIGERVLSWARDGEKKYGEQEVARDIIGLECELDSFWEKSGYVGHDMEAELLLKYPGFLGRICLESDVLDFERYGF